MTRSIATFQAKCSSCAQHFEHPSLGSQAYGEALLCSSNGQTYVLANAFSDVPQRVSALLPHAVAGTFWNVVAELADSRDGQHFKTGVRCPACSSERLEFWNGQRLGLADVQDATFTEAEALSTSELEEHILKSLEATISSGKQ